MSYASGCIRCEYHQLLYFNHFLALNVVNSKAKGHSLLADHKSWELFAILLKFQERKNDSGEVGWPWGWRGSWD